MRPLKRSLLLVLVGGLLVGGGLYPTVRTARPAAPLRELERVHLSRVLAARLSIPTRYRPCAEAPVPNGAGARGLGCSGRRVNGERPLHLAPLVFARESVDPDSLHAAALVTVLWGDATEASLNEAVQLLSAALRLGGDPVPLLVDLSAVHLARANLTGNPQDLEAALDRALEALHHSPRNPAARFNAALAAEALSLDRQARQRWNAYLWVDFTSPWRREARDRRRALPQQPPAPRIPDASASAEEVDAFAARYPQEARMLGWDSVLGRWGDAALHGRAAEADRQLTLAQRLGAALERRPGGDASLAEAVAAIRAVRSDAAATRILAQVHGAYSHAISVGDSTAMASLARAVLLKPRSPVLIRYAHAARLARMVAGKTPDGVPAALQSLLSDPQVIRHHALTARLNWILGQSLFKEGRFRSAREPFNRAARGYAGLREAENYGATRALEGWALYEAGDSVRAYRSANQALRALRPYWNSVRLHSVLFDMAKYAVRDEMPWAAEAFLIESLVVARQAGTATEIVQALIARAEHRAGRGEIRRAAQDLDAAEALLPKVDDPVVEKRLRSMRAVTDARSPADLKDAIAFFATDKAVWQMQALMRRADLYMAAGEIELASADLDRVTTHFQTTAQEEQNFHLRSAVTEQARSLFDRLVTLYVGAGRPVEALRTLERGRVSFGRDGDARNPRGPVAAPPGYVALEYALIGDTLLIWRIRGSSVTRYKRTVDRDTVLYAIEQANAGLRSVQRGPRAMPHLRNLHQWLVAPVRDSLGPRGTPLLIVADGEIAGVPFPALLNARDGRYLALDHPLRHAATLAEAAGPPRPVRAAGPALLIADPAFRRQEHRELVPLPGARAEMNALLRYYPRADTLSGTRATVDALRARAPRAGVIHYAGHAIFDDTRPERSFLVLAGTGRLQADAVGTMDLRGVEIIVLSACSTLRSRQGRSGGFAGLSGALLSAGAGGVVGSLWKVDDALAQPLMLAFHREYRASGDPVQALWQAQLAMMGSENLAERSPAAWAGFRYVGR